MTTQALRKQITALVNTIDDEAVLQSILTLLEKTKVDDEDEHLAGYDVQGNPISEEELVQSLLAESAAIRKEGGTTLKEMRKTMGLD